MLYCLRGRWTPLVYYTSRLERFRVTCNSSLNESYDYVYRVIKLISKTRPKNKQLLLLVSFHLSLFSINLDIVELHNFALFPALSMPILLVMWSLTSERPQCAKENVPDSLFPGFLSTGQNRTTDK